MHTWAPACKTRERWAADAHPISRQKPTRLVMSGWILHGVTGGSAYTDHRPQLSAETRYGTAEKSPTSRWRMTFIMVGMGEVKSSHAATHPSQPK